MQLLRRLKTQKGRRHKPRKLLAGKSYGKGFKKGKLKVEDTVTLSFMEKSRMSICIHLFDLYIITHHGFLCLAHQPLVVFSTAFRMEVPSVLLDWPDPALRS